jgi:steroid 5-alpha reductase family enzyme
MTDTDSRPPVAKSLLGILITTGLGAALAAAGSSGSLPVAGVPAFALAAVLAFAIQWVVFLPAYLSQSERFYDLTGSLTYLSVAVFAFGVKGDDRSMLLLILIAVWAVRLGSFLFLRIRDAGSDRRFDRIKPYFFRFLMTWTIQGLWVLVTAGAAIAAMTSSSSPPLGPVGLTGVMIWVIGFTIEVVADRQKRAFRRVPENSERYISHGLWAWSRHPNYFGEIMLWLGIAVIAAPALEGWQYATLVSPVFVFLLLTRVSGIPLLDAHARKRWGDEPDYKAYRKRTPALLPRPPRSNTRGS